MIAAGMIPGFLMLLQVLSENSKTLWPILYIQDEHQACSPPLFSKITQSFKIRFLKFLNIYQILKLLYYLRRIIFLKNQYSNE